jgi:carboxymethylenebutenolidase
MLTTLVLMLAMLAAAEAPATTPPAATAPSLPPSAPPATQTATAAAKPPATGVALPPGEAGAKAVLETSPRHGEWSDVPGPGGAPVRVWTVYPERKDKAPVVIVLMEVFGLTDWIRAVADGFAAEGFIAVAPDMLSGKAPGGGGSEAVTGRDDAVALTRALTPEEVVARLDAVRNWALRLPAANGRSGIAGFCWGGGRSFAYALAQPGLDAAIVYYGSSPADPAALAGLRVPVLGLYGGDDERVNATIDPAREAIARAGRTYEVEIYDGAGHGFLRQQDGRDGANLKASQAAWPRTLDFLRKHMAAPAAAPTKKPSGG